MTAAQITEREADWVIAWRLINWQPPSCIPTDEEYRLAVWLMLDRGLSHADIVERTELARGRVSSIAELRTLAENPQEGDKARQLAPTVEQRARIGIRRGITRPLAVTGRRRLRSVS